MKSSVAGQMIGCLPVDLDPAACTLDTGGIITHFGDPTLTKNSVSLERMNAILFCCRKESACRCNESVAHMSTCNGFQKCRKPALMNVPIYLFYILDI